MADGRAEQEASVRDYGVNHVRPVLATQQAVEIGPMTVSKRTLTQRQHPPK
jgi:hypothetical protein